MNLSVAYIHDHSDNYRDAGSALRMDHNKLLVVTGGSDGNLYLFRDGSCLTSFAVDPGVKVHCLTYRGGHLWCGMASGVIKKFSGGMLSFAKTFCIDAEQRTEEIMKDQVRTGLRSQNSAIYDQIWR